MFNNCCFGAGGIDHAAGEGIAGFNLDGHIPFLFQIKGGNGGTSGNKGTAGGFDGFQGTFDAVKNIINNAGTQQDVHRSACTVNRITGLEACCFFINLYSCKLFVDTDNFTNQTGFSHIDHFHHGKGTGVPDGNNRTVDSVNNIIGCHVCFPSHLFHDSVTVRPECS